MLFRQLEYFVALASERHFARAASACYVSQPALSEAIRKLEQELNVPLVRRGQKFEGLTPEGERLVHWARRILADRDALKQEVTALQTGLTGELRLGVVPAASTTVALLTDPFCTAHPLVRVQLEVNLRSAGIIERVRRFELDAGILYPDQQDTEDLLVTPLYHEQPVLLAAPGLLDGATDDIAWADAVQLPLCLLTQGMRGRRDIVKYADSFGAKGYRISHAEELLPTLKAALADDGVSLICCPVDYSENLRLTDRLGELDETL